MAKTGFRIGISGASREFSQQDSTKATELGKAIAEKGCIAVTGACTGLPDFAAQGAKSAGGRCFGVSPAKNLKEHQEKYNYPKEEFEFIAFTGLGWEVRNSVFVHNCDAMIFVGGQIGTLQEFTICYAEEKIIGVLEGSGGISAELRGIAAKMRSELKPKIVYSSSPAELVARVVQELERA